MPLPDALDMVLADDAASPIDVPGWDNSAMDGYAARSVDVAGHDPNRDSPIDLEIIETIQAGTFPRREIGRGQCARIFTGAPIPKGADSVIRQEDTTPLEGGQVRIDDSRDAGKNVRLRGEDIERGSIVLRSGCELGPAQLGVLASIAHSEVSVYRQPRVAIIASGDEIADLDEREEILSGRKIASSNTYTMLTMLRRAGAAVANLGVARDDPDDLRAKLQEAAGFDLLVTSGGVSVGQHDHVRDVLEELGTQMKFWRIKMRPGAPVGFGVFDGVPWIGLPGNPVSTMVTTELFVGPAVRKMSGHTTLFRRTARVKVAEPITLGPPLTHFLRVQVRSVNGERSARLTGPQGSGILMSMAKANALLIVPEDRSTVDAGAVLDAIMLNESAYVEEPPW